MKIRHALVLALVLFSSVFGLVACIGKKDNALTLRFRYWGDGDEVKIITGLLRDFEKQNPGVKIRDERKVMSGQTYADALSTEFAAGKGPDVIFMVAEIKDLLTEKGLLEDLSPMVAQDASLNLKDYYPSMVDRFSVDGHLYALPRDIAPFACIYYNKKLFDAKKVPYPTDDWNWKGLLDRAKALTERDSKGIGKVLGFADDWPMIGGWVLSSGGQMVDNYANPTKVTLDSEKALRGILFRWDMMFTHKVMPLTSDSKTLSQGSAGMFLNGTLAMYYCGVWKTPEFRKIDTFDWDFAMFPKGPDGTRGFDSGGSGYGISKGAANKELAWKLVRFLAGPEGQKAMATTGLTQPSIMSLADSPVFIDGQKPHNKKMLLKAAQIAVHPPASSKWLNFNTGVWAPITDVIWVQGFDRAKVADVVKRAVTEGNKKLFSK